MAQPAPAFSQPLAGCRELLGLDAVVSGVLERVHAEFGALLQACSSAARDDEKCVIPAAMVCNAPLPSPPVCASQALISSSVSMSD